MLHTCLENIIYKCVHNKASGIQFLNTNHTTNVKFPPLMSLVSLLTTAPWAFACTHVLSLSHPPSLFSSPSFSSSLSLLSIFLTLTQRLGKYEFVKESFGLGLWGCGKNMICLWVTLGFIPSTVKSKQEKSHWYCHLFQSL